MKNKKKIAVLMGGTSSEREISLESGKNIAAALESLDKYEVARVILDADNLDAMPKDVDAVYIALHGGWGESGGVQAALDALKIPYTGPGAEASRLAMDKIATKKRLEEYSLPTAKWYVIGPESRIDAPEEPLSLPVVVKTPRDGSSVGVYLARTPEEFRQSVEKCRKIDPAEVMVEEFIKGREMTVGIIGREPLPTIEIVAKDGWYGWEEKYFSDETRYPFLDDEALSAKLKDIALKAFDAVGCRGVTRVDFRVDENGNPYILELNTSPGFTAHSLVPKAGMKTGRTFAEVVEAILNSYTTMQ